MVNNNVFAMHPVFDYVHEYADLSQTASELGDLEEDLFQAFGLRWQPASCIYLLNRSPDGFISHPFINKIDSDYFTIERSHFVC